MTPAWREYQEDAAAQFRALGLSAETEQWLDGTRTRHRVDVEVRGNRAGMTFLWVVECKYWNSRVPKAAVATLSSILQDVGADRGILLSEKGFQSGAKNLARNTNIALTSLDEMRVTTYHEWVEYQCAALVKRCKAAREEVRLRTEFSSKGRVKFAKVPGGLDTNLVMGRTGMLEMYIEHGALKDVWPLTVKVFNPDTQTESKMRTKNFAEFLEVAESQMADIEKAVKTWISRLPPDK